MNIPEYERFRCANCRERLKPDEDALIRDGSIPEDKLVGRCCTGATDHGWGDAPEHGYDY